VDGLTEYSAAAMAWVVLEVSKTWTTDCAKSVDWESK
jgi:hypothetical protein